MGEVFLWSGIYLATMFLGYALKRLGVFRAEDKKFLADLIFYITLPAMLVSSFSGASVDFWFVVAFAMGLAVNGVLLAAGMVLSRRKAPDLQALYIINCPGLNLGNIVIPFLANFFPAGIPYLCMADTADSFFSLGTTYAIAGTRLGRKAESFGAILKAILRSLSRSVPMIVYVVMCILSLLDLQLPGPILQAADFMGRGNGFLAMLLVGLSLEINLDRSSVGEVVSILGIRYLCAGAMALGLWFLLAGAPPAMRSILVLACFAPTTSAALIYTNRLGVRTDIAGALMPISTVLMIPIMSAVMLLMG